MMMTWQKGLLGLILTVSTTALCAQELIIYPKKGQSAQQQEKDKFECYGWAKKSSGFDPMAPPVSSSPPPSDQKQTGGTARGVVGGAALGAIIGDSSKSTKRGAGAGALIGANRQAKQNQNTDKNRQNWEQQQASQYSNARSGYNRAYSACMEGRDYTVK